MSLKVPLASDEDGAISDAFGTWVEKSMYGRKYMGMERATYPDRRRRPGPEGVAQGQSAGPCGGSAEVGLDPLITGADAKGGKRVRPGQWSANAARALKRVAGVPPRVQTHFAQDRCISPKTAPFRC